MDLDDLIFLAAAAILGGVVDGRPSSAKKRERAIEEARALWKTYRDLDGARGLDGAWGGDD